MSGRRKDRDNFRDAIVAFLLERDGNICTSCLKPLGALGFNVTIDHIIARTDGGLDRMENYRLLHRGCNVHEYWKDGRKLSREVVMNRPQNQKGRIHSEKARSLIAESLRGRKRPPEVLIKAWKTRKLEQDDIVGLDDEVF